MNTTSSGCITYIFINIFGRRLVIRLKKTKDKIKARLTSSNQIDSFYLHTQSYDSVSIRCSFEFLYHN